MSNYIDAIEGKHTDGSEYGNDVKIEIIYDKEDIEEMLGRKLSDDYWESLADRVERKIDTWELVQEYVEIYDEEE